MHQFYRLGEGGCAGEATSDQGQLDLPDHHKTFL